jgi:hypothetical protein
VSRIEEIKARLAAFTRNTDKEYEFPFEEVVENAPADIEYLMGLVARMLPLVNHSERADCPMAFHRSDGEQCTCGALDVIREARATAAKGVTS